MTKNGSSPIIDDYITHLHDNLYITYKSILFCIKYINYTSNLVVQFGSPICGCVEGLEDLVINEVLDFSEYARGLFFFWALLYQKVAGVAVGVDKVIENEHAEKGVQTDERQSLP